MDYFEKMLDQSKKKDKLRDKKRNLITKMIVTEKKLFYTQIREKEYQDQIEKYSYFNTYELASVIRDLISIMDDVSYDVKILEEDSTTDFYNDEQSHFKQLLIGSNDPLSDENYILKIFDEEDPLYSPTFINNDNMIEYVYSNLGLPSYVEDFIKFVINYKIDNNIMDLNLESLYELKDAFIENNVNNNTEVLIRIKKDE